jgi:hypothetical protein
MPTLPRQCLVGFADYTLHCPKLRLFTLWKAQFPGTAHGLLSKSGRCGTRALHKQKDGDVNAI